MGSEELVDAITRGNVPQVKTVLADDHSGSGS
jgi:hypothetical protein